ncbi:MAG: hypothetical protein DRJ15_08755 [Bacteroidetes bacterium]|nr:MAG: hypothetical protein DRJ15_08755 [Bacteroidota bacterium]
MNIDLSKDDALEKIIEKNLDKIPVMFSTIKELGYSYLGRADDGKYYFQKGDLVSSFVEAKNDYLFPDRQCYKKISHEHKPDDL